MKKKIIFIILAISVLILGVRLFIYFQHNAIKKGDIFNNVSFKENIPNIKSESEVAITVEDISITYIYLEEYSCYLIGIILENDDSYIYYYSFDDVYSDGGNITFRKGWNSVKSKDYKITPLSSCPIETIEGTVTYTTGNTSLIKKCLQGL